jgi:hypothetical protein
MIVFLAMTNLLAMPLANSAVVETTTWYTKPA